MIDKIHRHKIKPGIKSIPGVKNIIAIGSGKGGVGKSTTAVNLALALQSQGARVGIMDADIHGPSMAMMLGVNEHPSSKDEKKIEPIIRFGLQTMSLAYMMDADDTPAIWRGPISSRALMQLLNDTRWDDLDYLILDLPPGTGDIQLTMSQKIPVSGAVIVTTPQDVALIDAKKALRMFNKVDIPVLGIIENMSMHICDNCGHQSHPFGKAGGENMANLLEIPLLGQLPLNLSIREDLDNGTPTVEHSPNGEITAKYLACAERLSQVLSKQPRHYGALMPDVVVENIHGEKE